MKTTFLSWVKFIIVTIFYLLFVIWDHNYWLLIGCFFIFDLFISKIVPWEIYKKCSNRKIKKTMEWLDSIVFALISVYFIHIFTFQHYEIPTSSLEKTLLVGDYILVSKLSYGPRIPNTPLAFPITHHTFPILNVKSYSDYPHWAYKRLKGLGKIKRGDIVVFNFPAGDTVAFNYQDQDYYDLIFQEGWQNIHLKQNKYGKIISRPVDRRENYVKRCIGLPGDSLQIIKNIVYINRVALPTPKNAQFNFFVETFGNLISEKQFEKLGISKSDQLICNQYSMSRFLFNTLGIKPNKNGNYNPIYHLPLTKMAIKNLKKNGLAKSIYMEPEFFGGKMYPYTYKTSWTRENFGPIWIPKKGVTITLNNKNLALYERCIVNYEGNTLQRNGNQILINGILTCRYTFQYDYYFMMGDNRHNSLDSRMWGFVPEDHIVGKSLLILFSFDEDHNWLDGKIRWNRIFKLVK